MKKNILFVDDDPELLNGLRAFLHGMRREWDSFFAPSGEEALTLMDSTLIDVVVADARMPGMEGDRLLKEVQRLQPGAVRIILSGYSNLNTIMKSVKTAHQYLSKPCSSIDIVKTIERVLRLRDIFLNKSVVRAISAIDSLPALPELFLQLEQELGKKEPSLKEAGRLIESDMGMTTSVLKLVNSSFFGLPQQVSSPSQAAAYLGLNTLRGLVLEVQLFSRCRENFSSKFPLGYLENHSQVVGLYSKAIASVETGNRTTVDDSFLAGLLHDLGKLLLAMEFYDSYLKILDLAAKKNIPILEAELEILGFSHAEVGAYLLALWGFSEDIAVAVYAHHDLTRLDAKGFCPALGVHAANSLEHELNVSHKNFASHPVDTQWFEKNHMTERLVTWRNICESSPHMGKGNEK